MSLITFVFTDASWYFKCDTGEFTFFTIEEAEQFIKNNSFDLTLRGCCDI